VSEVRSALCGLASQPGVDAALAQSKKADTEGTSTA
jgi:hypothetical protein